MNSVEWREEDGARGYSRTTQVKLSHDREDDDDEKERQMSCSIHELLLVSG